MANETDFAITGFPYGSIIAFAGERNNIPVGWLECNGKLVKKNEFPKLFNSIGTVWGGSGTPDFYLPDFRGMFLRGVAGDAATDPDKDGRESPQTAHAPANPGNRGNAVGSLQGDQFRAHSHSINPSHAFMDNDIGPNSVQGNGNVNYGRAGISAANNGGSETRPCNAYVYYIIKVDERVN